MNTQLCSFKTCIPVSCSLSTFGNVFGHTTLTFCSMFTFMFLFHVILPFYHRTTENPVSHRYKVVERNTVQSNVETELPWAISSHGVQQMSLCFPWKFEISLLAKLWVCYGTLGALAHGLGTVVQACSLPYLFLFLILMTLLGHTHFNYKSNFRPSHGLISSFALVDSWPEFKVTLYSPLLIPYTTLDKSLLCVQT